eukprot:201484-Chlamydomonas_euryale.AAC.3
MYTPLTASPTGPQRRAAAHTGVCNGSTSRGRGRRCGKGTRRWGARSLGGDGTSGGGGVTASGVPGLARPVWAPGYPPFEHADGGPRDRAGISGCVATQAAAAWLRSDAIREVQLLQLRGIKEERERASTYWRGTEVPPASQWWARPGRKKTDCVAFWHKRGSQNQSDASSWAAGASSWAAGGLDGRAKHAMWCHTSVGWGAEGAIVRVG